MLHCALTPRPDFDAASSTTFTIASAVSAPDARADGGTRQIRLSRLNVRIARQVSGIKMHLAVPVDAYKGVILTADHTSAQRLFRILLSHPDPELSVELYSAPQLTAVLAIWRSWADFFSMPALCAEIAGDRANAGVPHGHRRGRGLDARRPRCLKRRSCAPLSASSRACHFAVGLLRSD